MQFNFEQTNSTYTTLKITGYIEQNPAEFIQAKTDSDICLTFAMSF